MNRLVLIHTSTLVSTFTVNAFSQRQRVLRILKVSLNIQGSTEGAKIYQHITLVATHQLRHWETAGLCISATFIGVLPLPTTLFVAIWELKKERMIKTEGERVTTWKDKESWTIYWNWSTETAMFLHFRLNINNFRELVISFERYCVITF